jgi:hypothetical protein
MTVIQNITNILRKDQFGVLWFSFMYAAVLVGKWWYFEETKPGEGGCLLCVVIVLWLLALVFGMLLTAVWVLWETKGGKTVSMVFVLMLIALASAVMFDVGAQKIIAKLYHAGWIGWAEAEATYLFEVMLHHAAGLYLACLVLYTGLRVAFSSSFTDRRTVVPVGLIFVGTATLLLFIGVILY